MSTLKSNYYSVLFTGGLDSTYRLCQLAQDENAVIQPVYILCPANGKSLDIRIELQKEIEAQDKILSYLISHLNTKAIVLPILRIQRDDIPKDQRILDLRTSLAYYNFGWQYLYIAMLSKWFPAIELCQEVYFSNDVFFKKVNNRTYIDENKSEQLFVSLFKDVTWPIIGVKRQQMIKDLEKWNYEEILKKVWFCYQAIDGKPCGICDNCRKKIADGLLFFFDSQAIHRYLVYLFIYDFLPVYVYELYMLFVYNKPQFKNYVGGTAEVNRWIRRFNKIDSLSNSTLEKIVLEGSYDFCDDYLQCKKRINSLRFNKARRERLVKQFESFKKYKKYKV